MKNLFAFLFLMIVASAFGGDKLPWLSVPKVVTFDRGPDFYTRIDPVRVNKDGVIYSAMAKGGLWIGFRADHKGNLLGFHIVRSDSIIFSWGTSVIVDDGNVVKTDVEAWKRLFKKKVVFNRPVEFSLY